MIESQENDFERFISSASQNEDAFENKLRPTLMDDYIGQDVVKANLGVAITAAKKRGEPLDHVLLHGAPGLGKTTLANIVAHEMGVNLRVSSGPALDKPSDIASILSNLEEGDVLFIDEIHRLKAVVEEVLYTAMEDFAIDIVIGKGPSARSMRINLPQFTLVGATTKLSLISSPMRDRFGSVFKLMSYEDDEIAMILRRSAKILETDLSENLSLRLASCCRRTPRIANRLLRRVRDFAEVHNDSIIDQGILSKSLAALGIDPLGLDYSDREILTLMIEKFSGGPVGLNTIAAAINEEQSTVEDIYEPFLLQLGMIQRTHRGRVATRAAYDHLGFEFPAEL